MTAFNADNFRGKLSRLSESSQSIPESGWIQYHKKHAVESAEVWAKETLVADPERQLLYIYLANDVMQHSRRKKTEQVKTFGGHMKAVLRRGVRRRPRVGALEAAADALDLGGAPDPLDARDQRDARRRLRRRRAAGGERGGRRRGRRRRGD